MKKTILLLILFIIPLVQAVNMTSGVINLTAIDSWITFDSSVYFDKVIVRDNVAEFYNLSRTIDGETIDCNLSTSGSRATSASLLDYCFPTAELGAGSTGGSAAKQEYVSGKEEEKKLAEAGNCTDTNLLERIMSKCRIPDNGICDDGEWIILDKDCSFASDNFNKGDFLRSMWLLRVLLIISLVMFIKKSPNFPLIVLLIVILLVLNGAFGEFNMINFGNFFSGAVKGVKGIDNVGQKLDNFERILILALVVIWIFIIKKIFDRKKKGVGR